MANELVCNEDELEMVCRQLERYYTHLETCFSKYSQIMDNIVSSGVDDTLITNSIRNLQGMAQQQQTILMDTLQPLSDSVKRHITGLENADNFRYPDMSMSDIISLLASFL